MKHRILQTIVVLMTIVGSVTAQTLSVTSIEANVGEQAELVVSASGMNNVTALQFNLVPLEGFTLNESAITKGEAASGHTLSVQPLDGGGRLFVLYHTDLKQIGDGVLLRIPFMRQKSCHYEKYLYIVRAATVDAVSLACPNAFFSITVKEPEPPVTITANNLTIT